MAFIDELSSQLRWWSPWYVPSFKLPIKPKANKWSFKRCLDLSKVRLAAEPRLPGRLQVSRRCISDQQGGPLCQQYSTYCEKRVGFSVFRPFRQASKASHSKSQMSSANEI